MSDFEKLINASDLIEWIIETDPDWCVGSVRSIIDHIDKMPSAQPEKRTDKCTKTHSCDLISRQAVIDTVRKIILGFFSDEDGAMTDTEKTLLSVNKAVCNGVRELPSASRPHGQWLFSPDDAEGTCTICQYKIYGRKYQGHYLIVPYNFCPNCGADMTEEKE